MKTHILVVEDETQIARVVKLELGMRVIILVPINNENHSLEIGERLGLLLLNKFGPHFYITEQKISFSTNEVECE